MKIIFICFTSGLILEEFARQGHEVTSLDIFPAKHKFRHIIADIDLYDPVGYDMAICCPPCQFLTNPQIHMLKHDPTRLEAAYHAMSRVQRIFSFGIPKILIENPPGLLNSCWLPPSQIIKPSYFGDPYGKKLCLWLKGLPPLISTCINPLEKSFSNHTNSRMSQVQRSAIRSDWNRYPNMIKALVDQYGGL